MPVNGITGSRITAGRGILQRLLFFIRILLLKQGVNLFSDTIDFFKGFQTVSFKFHGFV